MRRRTVALLSVIASLLTVIIAAPLVSAAPPGKGPCSSPTLSGPTSAVVGDDYAITGCGFPANAMVALEIGEADGCCGAQMIYTSGTGTFTYRSSVWAAGSYRLRASVDRRNGWTVVATWTFEAS